MKAGNEKPVNRLASQVTRNKRSKPRVLILKDNTYGFDLDFIVQNQIKKFADPCVITETKTHWIIEPSCNSKSYETWLREMERYVGSYGFEYKFLYEVGR